MGEAKKRAAYKSKSDPDMAAIRTSNGGLARDLLGIAKIHRTEAGTSPEAVIAGARLAVANGASIVGLFVEIGPVGGKPAYDGYLYDGAGENPECGLSAFIVRGSEAEVALVRAEMRRLLPGSIRSFN